MQEFYFLTKGIVEQNWYHKNYFDLAVDLKGDDSVEK